MYLIKRASEISGVSVRTLQHYDKIGILSPKRHENGYRYYSEEDMSTLQTILFYKYLGFSLKHIKEIMEKEDDDIIVHLRRQLSLMKNKKDKLLTLIETLEKTIEAEERKQVMLTEEKFIGFKYEDSENYKDEAIELYGKEVIEKAMQKQKGKEEEITEGFNKIFLSFSKKKSNGLSATAKENIELARDLHNHICKYAFDCTKEVLSKIGYGYAKNGEFKNNIDKFGDGMAEYVCDAIQKYISL